MTLKILGVCFFVKKCRRRIPHVAMREIESMFVGEELKQNKTKKHDRHYAHQGHGPATQQ